MLQFILCSILTVSMVQAAGSKKPMKDDEIQTEQSPMQLKPFPDVQLSMDRQSALKIHQTQKLIELTKGTIRVKAKTESENKEALIKAGNIAFIVQGQAEFEVSMKPDQVDLNVIEGEVEASSPLVMTFVPEIIKAKEGFRFTESLKKFERKKFELDFEEHPGF